VGQTTIFVSHSHQDNDWCRPFVEALKSVGYDVWYDEQGLQGGAQWIATIQHEVQARDVFIVILTPEAWSSQWVQDELQLAIATRRRILPVLLRNCQVDGFLLTTQWVTVLGLTPQDAARSVIIAVEAPPAPGRSSSQQATETLDELVTLCRTLTNERRFTEALSACSRALALDSNNVEVLRLEGWILLKVGEHAKAMEVLGQMLSFSSAERVPQLAREVVDWLYDEKNDENLEHSSALLTSHLTSGPALYGFLCELCGSISYVQAEQWSQPGRNSFEGALRESVSRMTRADVLKAGLEVASNSGKSANMSAVVLIAEGCYGYPPDRATSADIENLRLYRDALAGLGRTLQRDMVESYLQRLSQK
jgi:tetratricopeptide (TPR) repeat protein